MEATDFNFSYYRSMYNTKTIRNIDIPKLDMLCKSEGMRILTENYRTDLDKRKKLEFPMITPSGEFEKRGKKYLIKHSKIITVDIDKIENVKEVKKRLKKDPIINYMYTSPSDNGIKAFIKIDAEKEKEHKEFFHALEKYFKTKYNIEIDPACKDISRGCLLCYDEDSYCNKDSTMLKEDFILKYAPITKIKKIEKTNKKTNTSYQYVIDNAVEKFWGLDDGKKYHALYKLAVHLGYYVNAKLLTYSECYNALERAVEERKEKMNDIGDIKVAESQIKKGLLYGLENPKPVNGIKTSKRNYQFWFAHDSKVFIGIMSYYKFLNRNGFWGYIYDKARKLIRIKNNIVSIIEKEDIMDFILENIRSQPYDIGNGINRDKLEKRYRDGMYYLNSKDQLMAIKKINKPFLKDTINTAYINYENGVMKITKDSSELIAYKDIEELIWDTSIINRKFNPTDKQLKEYEDKSDYIRFIKGVTGELTDELFSRYESMKTIIGYLLHEYKDPSLAIAIIFCDEDKSKNPEGGTGKGIVLTSLSYLKNMVSEDGKNFNFNKNFAFQKVDLDTKLLAFDDVPMKFDFQQLFSVITEGITVEKKQKQAFYMPYKDSPKIVIATNYMLSGEGNSHRRRKVEIEFSTYYNENHTPLKEFGRLLFNDWDDEQWLYFDMFMVDCLKSYLKNGIIKPVIKNIPLRKLQQATSDEFVEYSQLKLSALIMGKGYDKKQLKEEFLSTYQHLKADYSLTQTKFNRWLHSYGETMDLIVTDRTSANVPLIYFDKK